MGNMKSACEARVLDYNYGSLGVVAHSGKERPEHNITDSKNISRWYVDGQEKCQSSHHMKDEFEVESGTQIDLKEECRDYVTLTLAPTRAASC